MSRRVALAARLASFASVLALASACQTEEAKQCRALMASAQETVKGVRSSELDSVKKSLDAVEAARGACEIAKLGREHDELLKAKNKLSAHYEYLKRKAEEPAQRKLTPEELEELVQNGDPSCPKGQAYKHGESGKEIRCKGPQPVNMSLARARQYFEGRGYKVSNPEGPSTLKAEYGSEILLYRFDSASDANAPKCLTVFPPPGMSWQEAVARVSGVPPFRVEEGMTIATRRGEAALRVVNAEDKPVIHIGDCAGS